MRVGVGVGPVYASGSPSGCLTLIGNTILLPFHVARLLVWFVVKVAKLVYRVGVVLYRVGVVLYGAGVGLYKAGKRVYRSIQSRRAARLTPVAPSYVNRGQWIQ